jgi:hypothetical protein
MRHTRSKHAAAAAAVLGLALAAACANRDEVDIGFPEQPAPPESGMQIAFTPDGGPVGTPVTVSAQGFAPEQAVVIGFGPPESEYEVIERVRTDGFGNVTATVEVPDWAEAGRSYVWVVAEPDAQPKVIADDHFRVRAGGTAPGDTVRIRGTVTGAGVECPAVRTDRGRLYTLATRDLQDVAEGDRVVVTGTLADVSTCMQGTTVAVTRIEKVRS